jgi:hypothetical protein
LARARKWRARLTSRCAKACSPDAGGAAGRSDPVAIQVGSFVSSSGGKQPWVVACSRHMGRWRLAGHCQVSAGNMRATLALRQAEDGWVMHTADYLRPHQIPNFGATPTWCPGTAARRGATIAVHRGPISAPDFRHQAIRMRRARPGIDAPSRRRIECAARSARIRGDSAAAERGRAAPDVAVGSTGPLEQSL